MLLFEALTTADCTICLQPLEFNHSTGPSPAPSPHKSRKDDSSNDFRISYAPGVRPAHDDEEHLYSGLGNDATLFTKSNDTDAVVPGGEGDVVVLSCGHFLHALCLQQLIEFRKGMTKGPECPVCRTEIKHIPSEVILFRPHTRPPRLAGGALRNDTPTAAGNAGAAHMSTPTKQRPKRSRLLLSASERSPAKKLRQDAQHDDSADTSNSGLVILGEHHVVQGGDGEPHDDTESGGDDDEDDIQLLGTAQIPLTRAYRDLLDRSSEQMKQRSEILHEREKHLRTSLKQLDQDCADVARSVAEMKERYELMGGSGRGSDGPHHALTATGAEQRRQELLRVCKETKASCDEATAELAAANRENADLQRQLDSFGRKMERLEKKE